MKRHEELDKYLRCTCRLDASPEPHALRHMVQFLYSVHAGVRIVICMRVRVGPAMTSPTFWRGQNHLDMARRKLMIRFGSNLRGRKEEIDETR